MITPITPATITLKVFDPVAYYPSPGPAFTEFPDSKSTAIGNPNLCPKSYTVSISPNTITTFSLDTATNTFRVYSGAINQIRTYTVTLYGAL